jgi:DNA-binding NarL/FixJ family response regulator
MKAKPIILLVDNEPGFRTSLAKALTAHGYLVRTANGRADARESLYAEIPDLAIVGTASPRGDAFALCEWMRTTIPLNEIPILVIDAPAEKQLLEGWLWHEGMRMHAEDYLAKPLEPSALLPRIARLLDRTTSRVKVLVVDDHALVREGITALLSLQHDLQVVGVADNGRDALDKVAEFEPDVVVMDLRMPVMDGLEATREICSRSSGARVLMLSQYDDEENVIASKRAGAWDLISKQSASGRLVDAVRAAGRAA